MGKKTLARLVCAAAVVAGLGGAGNSQPAPRDRILRNVDSTQVAVVKRTAHPMARPESDQGRVSPDQQLTGVTLTFRLSPAQQADLDQLLRQQQDRSSPLYHHWLTPDQYAQRFGMTENDLAKITSWLESQGLTIDGIARNRNEISFSGSVGQIEYALKTEIHNYSIGGKRHFANATDISLPAAFADTVVGVRGLNDFRPKPRVHRALPRFTSSISGNHFVIPGDFAKIYDVPSAYDGTGQKIVVVGQTDISNTDIDAFRSASGLAKKDPTKVLVPNTGTLTVSTGDETEADLDLEYSGAVAANATIVYVTVGGNQSFNVFDSLKYAIQNNLAPVISISYGNCESALGQSFVLSLQQTAQQANAQGQTIVGPAGDSGAADCDTGSSATHGLQVDVPAAIPEVTGVGGTEFTGDSAATVSGNCASATTYWSGSCGTSSTQGNATGASALTYIPEQTWNDTTASGNNGGLDAGGGGASTIFAKPSWQAGSGVPADGARDVPDLALNASNQHDPYLICSQDFFAGSNPPVTSCTSGFRASDDTLAAIGGTSADAPTFAGIVALINQATHSNGLGNVNPMLYSLASSSSSAFHDIMSGTNNVPCTTGTTDCPTGTASIGFSAGPGYDQVTGLGSLDVGQLITAWMASTPSADFSLDGLVSTASGPGQSGTSTITVTALNGFTGTVDLTCSPSSQSAQISCSLNPNSLDMSTGTTNKTKTSQLTIITVAELGAPKGMHWKGVWFAGSGVFAAVLLSGISRRRRWMWLTGLFMTAALVTFVACGGGGNSNTQQKSQGTPTGTYSITVTGTSGATSHSTVVSFTLQ